MARPKGTTRRPASPPDSTIEAIVRAIFPPSFPVELGWTLYRINSLSREREAIKEAIKAGLHSKEETAARLDYVKKDFHKLTEALGLQCQLAVIQGRPEFLETVAKGVASLTSITKRHLAIADAWLFFVGSGKPEPEPGEVASLANTFTDELISASNVRDTAEKMGLAMKAKARRKAGGD